MLHDFPEAVPEIRNKKADQMSEEHMLGKDTV